MRRLIHDEGGISTAEYALVLALFAMVMVAALNLMSAHAATNYTSSTASMTQLQDAPP